MKPTHTLSLSLRLRERCMIFLVGITYPVYVRLFRRHRPAWQQDQRSLRYYESGSLGRALGFFLAENDMELMPYLENHDVFHVLLNYDATVLAESEMQFCLLGNGKRSLFVLGTCAIAWLAFPEYWSAFRRAFRRGKQLRRFYHWYFEYLLNESLEDLKQFIEGEKMEHLKF